MSKIIHSCKTQKLRQIGICKSKAYINLLQLQLLVRRRNDEIDRTRIIVKRDFAVTHEDRVLAESQVWIIQRRDVTKELVQVIDAKLFRQSIFNLCFDKNGLFRRNGLLNISLLKNDSRIDGRKVLQYTQGVFTQLHNIISKLV